MVSADVCIYSRVLLAYIARLTTDVIPERTGIRKRRYFYHGQKDALDGLEKNIVWLLFIPLQWQRYIALN